VDGIWTTKSEGVGLIVRYLVFKISNLCDHGPPMSQTDGQTDRQTDREHAIVIPRFAL